MKTVSLLSQRFPLGGVLIAAITGILLASRLGPTWELTLGLGVILMLLILIHVRGGIVLAFTATVFALLQLWCWNDAPARRLAQWFDGHPGEFEVRGVVASEPRVSSSGTAAFSMRVETIREPGSTGKAIELPVLVQVKWAGKSPSYGDCITFQAMPVRPLPPRNPGGFDYALWLERHGIYTQFNLDPAEPGCILSHDHGNLIMAWAILARQRMEAILGIDMQGAPMELSAIRGITLGVTENAPEGFTEDFRFTGTMHLFAVSGLHVGMLAVMIWFVFMAARVPRPWAVAMIIPMLFFYVAVTGLKSGSIRSVSMVSLLLIGSMVYRRAPLFNTLAAAALLQLAIDPNALFSAGWQFSYSVVFAILALAPGLEKRLCALYSADPFIPSRLLTRWELSRYDAWHYLSGLLAVSFAAWVGSLIPTIVYFHLVSFSAIGANLLAVPLAFGVLALGVLSLLTGGISLWTAGAFNNANWLVAKLLLAVVQASAMLPGGHWFVGGDLKSYPEITLLDLGGNSCAVVRSGFDFAMVNAGRRKDAAGDILPFLESQGCNSLSNILVTKSDAAHLGGLPELEREIRIKRLCLVSESMSSPVAKSVLKEFANPVTHLSRGISFPFFRGVDAEVLSLPGDAAAVRLHCGGIPVLFLPPVTPELSRELLLTVAGEKVRGGVLVVPLGGSEILSTLEVIRRIAPKFVVTLVDKFNRNGIPSREWDHLLASEGIELLRQDETGAVLIEVRPEQLKVRPFVSR